MFDFSHSFGHRSLFPPPGKTSCIKEPQESQNGNNSGIVSKVHAQLLCHLYIGIIRLKVKNNWDLFTFDCFVHVLV